MMTVNFKVLARTLRLAVPLSLAAVALACTTEPQPTATVPNVQATVQAEVVNQLAAVPTATAWPTNTPYPTATAYPTSTPYPTGTPLPTASPYPTATPYPTYTPYPTPTAAATPTPQPTYTPYPTPAAPALVIQRQEVPTPVPVDPSAVQRAPLGSFAELDTTGRADQILRTHILGSTNCSAVAELSQELSRQQDAAILKVYNLRVFVSSPSRVECAGTARWSQGDDSPIYVFVENDGDGDNFYGYRSEARGFN